MAAPKHPLYPVISQVANITHNTDCWICPHRQALEDDITLLLAVTLSIEEIVNIQAQYSGFDYTTYTHTKNAGLRGKPRPMDPSWQSSTMTKWIGKAPEMACKASLYIRNSKGPSPFLGALTQHIAILTLSYNQVHQEQGPYDDSVNSLWTPTGFLCLGETTKLMPARLMMITLCL